MDGSDLPPEQKTRASILPQQEFDQLVRSRFIFAAAGAGYVSWCLCTFVITLGF